MQVFLKVGSENTGGMREPLFFLSQHFLYFLHWLALSELVSCLDLVRKS
jgi:hypothetical protein